jgi:ABC-2 type transport system permease protein
MTTWMPWKIASKEFKVTRRKKSVISYVVALPLLLAVFFTLVVMSDIAPSAGISSNYQLGFESLIYFFVVFSAIVPSSIAAYSIVGEKVEKSLEPLLATPVTDGEILLGKSMSAFIPSIVSIWMGASIFMATSDYLTHDLLSFYFFPNWNALIMLFLLAPLAAIMSIELAVIVSSRVTDVRGANQLASMMFVPFMVVFVAALEGIFPFSVQNLLIFSGVVLIADVALFFVSKSTFNREDILTKWK